MARQCIIDFSDLPRGREHEHEHEHEHSDRRLHLFGSWTPVNYLFDPSALTTPLTPIPSPLSLFIAYLRPSCGYLCIVFNRCSPSIAKPPSRRYYVLRSLLPTKHPRPPLSFIDLISRMMKFR